VDTDKTQFSIFYTAERTVGGLTDHQPLLGVAWNVLLHDIPQLDWLFDQIIGYDLQWSYVLGKANYLPDYLSRLPEDNIPPLPVEAADHCDMANACGPVYDVIAATSMADGVVDFVSQSKAANESRISRNSQVSHSNPS
jgi:hypothetical protein